ncbi:MAG: radical SAM protein [Thermodesulfobacteriota bacterium]
MKIALIYPPTADPTAPYLSVPILTGYLRSKGMEVLPIDANVEGYDFMLRPENLRKVAVLADRRLGQLKKEPLLDHGSQLEGLALFRASRFAHELPDKIQDALSVMRDPSGRRFYDPQSYEKAVVVIERALQLISAAHAPLALNFNSYRTPFALLSIREIAADARPERNPFHAYYSEVLCERLARENVGIAGISVAFPGQIQPAYALAYLLRRRFRNLHITVGGPAMTQALIRLSAGQLRRAMTPFHSAVLFEGEAALADLVRSVEKGKSPGGVIRGETATDLSDLPAPDYEGLPLGAYLSPEPVLSYDVSRGCYWGKCAFCYYGLAETGTTRYRERPLDRVMEHLNCLAEKHQGRIFFFSQDTLRPATARRLAAAVKDSRASWRWACDMRPEPALTPDCCRELAQGGALAFAVGVESGSPRVLKLIDKGIRRDAVASAVENLAAAGIAVEWMCFTHFPTENLSEALETLRFIEAQQENIALFTCGRFSLVHRAKVACRPEDYGIADVWQVAGDEFIQTLFYREKVPSRHPGDDDRIDAFIHRLSRGYWFHDYPWAGSLSTAHSYLWYDHYGPDVFRRFSKKRIRLKREVSTAAGRGMGRIAQLSGNNEEEIWRSLIYEKRTVSPESYRRMAEAITAVKNPFFKKIV